CTLECARTGSSTWRSKRSLKGRSDPRPGGGSAAGRAPAGQPAYRAAEARRGLRTENERLSGTMMAFLAHTSSHIEQPTHDLGSTRRAMPPNALSSSSKQLKGQISTQKRHPVHSSSIT